MPRPGALFVVGDPKQSIYRFRRADIQLYGLVKERFRAFGRVVQLTSNFRSRPPIGDLVNELFATDVPTPKEGMHDPRGLLVLAGPGIHRGLELKDVSPLDIAPTILHLLGVPRPATMKGRVLEEAWRTDEKVTSARAA